MRFITLALAMVSVSTFAQVWYGGSPSYDERVVNQIGGGFDHAIYENFQVSGPTNAVMAWCNMSAGFTPTQVLIEIRSNIGNGNPGTTHYSGYSQATSTALSGGPSGTQSFRVQAFLNQPVSLIPGITYWFTIVPIGQTGADPARLWTTMGNDAVGNPSMDGASYFYTGDDFYFGFSLNQNPNWSMGIDSVPEPTSLIAVIVGVIGLAARTRAGNCGKITA